jgi:hypothetical protein
MAPTVSRSVFPRLAAIGAALQILLAVALGIFLSIATDGPGDAVPRPLVVALLYSAPGVIAALGAIARRRSLLLVAALIAIPGARLSMVTLIFVVPGALFLVGASTLPRRQGSLGSNLVGTAGGVACLVLVLAAGWAVLIGLTRPACYSIPGGSGCSSAAISPGGVTVAAVLLAFAVGLASLVAAAKNAPRTEARD